MELKLKKSLEENKVEFEYQPKVFGNPDFLVKPNIAVFCDSSFWHGRNWNKLKLELTKKYWLDHINRNRKRDRLVNRTLRKDGYVVLRFWEEEIEKESERCLKKIREVLGEVNYPKEEKGSTA